MREEKEAVREHYDADPQKEWDRLQKRFPYEKSITTHMMDRYLRPGDSILDIGGGPGHYSIHCAKQGHSVVLLDLSEENVRFAKKKARLTIRELPLRKFLAMISCVRIVSFKNAIQIWQY